MAAGLLLVIVTLVLAYAQTEVRAHGGAIAPAMLLDEWEGRAAPLAVMQRDDLLPIFGSSELIVPMTNRATDFFASYPTGFALAPIGARGFPVLSMAVALGSLGSVIRDRRLVISLSGTWFAGDQPQYAAVNFRWHYSSLQTGDLVFRSGLPLELKRHFAKRILAYKSAGDIDPLVATALSCLARRCIFERLLPALVPLWMVESLPGRTRDSMHLATELRHATPTVRRASRPDWDALEKRGDSVWRAHSTSNAFGIEDSIWSATQAKILARRGTMNDSSFVGGMQRTPDWEDLDLLLATMKVLGARPLILSTPLKGAYWNHLGVSASARDRMYRRFDSVTAPFHFPARSFSEHDSDVTFLSEPRSHLSAKGWLTYDRTIDAFYHDARP
ncbi:MAG: D-alanyl-lipoteichoic acid biosynthesis protein DltD [Gemmatimonadetes bacterium]|nr:D-alanyl-lipoteichoic acid biosynthesis protein DltD [Gemmatimonadota bacterium]